MRTQSLLADFRVSEVKLNILDMLDLCDIVAKLQEKKRISFEGCFRPNSCVPIYF